MSTPTNARQHNPSLCPTWCAQEHLRDDVDDQVGGFHHDADRWQVKPSHQTGADDDDYVFVHVSQFVPEADSPQPVYVELQDSRRTIALLTPEEAAQLALALLSATATARGSA